MDGQPVTILEELLTHQPVDMDQSSDNLLKFQNNQPWILQLKLKGYYHWPLGHVLDYQSATPVLSPYKLYPLNHWIVLDDTHLSHWKFLKYQIKIINLQCQNGETSIVSYIL